MLHAQNLPSADLTQFVFRFRRNWIRRKACWQCAEGATWVLGVAVPERSWVGRLSGGFSPSTSSRYSAATGRPRFT